VSAAKAKSATKTWELTGSWANAWKIFAGIGAVGLLGAVAGFFQDRNRFAFSWMFAFITVLCVALGSLFFVLKQRLTSAGWSVTVRRTAEVFATGLLPLAALFAPIIVVMPQLFPWLAAEHAGHGEAHGALDKIELVRPAHAQDHAPAAPAATTHGEPAAAPAGSHPGPPGEKPAPHGGAGHAATAPAGHGAAHGAPGMIDPHALEHHEVMAKKAGYLNKNFFLLRVLVYFVVWIFVAFRLFGLSVQQDTSKDPQLTVRAQRFAPPATFAFALTLTFSAFDWIMSLEPSWFSTIFGVVIFASGVVSSYAVIILVTMALRKAGPLDGAVTVEHYHDLGKLMFGFLVFWAYVSFSQFMLIWYAALPEETTFFHNRWDYEPWSKVSLAIVVGHFVLPFFWLISRNFKRNLGRLQLGAAVLLVMHVVNIYWYVMPNVALGKNGFAFHWMDLACLFAVAGVYGAYVFYRMGKVSLVPVGDPRLQRSLHFQNA
jgi:hypothetical protein